MIKALFFPKGLFYNRYKNLDFNSGVGIIHISFFPNHLYRFLAIKSYTPFLIKVGIIRKKLRRFTGKLSCFAMVKAAVDLVDNPFSLEYNKMESNFEVSML